MGSVEQKNGHSIPWAGMQQQWVTALKVLLAHSHEEDGQKAWLMARGKIQRGKFHTKGAPACVRITGKTLQSLFDHLLFSLPLGAHHKSKSSLPQSHLQRKSSMPSSAAPQHQSWAAVSWIWDWLELGAVSKGNEAENIRN